MRLYVSRVTRLRLVIYSGRARRIVTQFLRRCVALRDLNVIQVRAESRLPLGAMAGGRHSTLQAHAQTSRSNGAANRHRSKTNIINRFINVSKKLGVDRVLVL